MLNKRFPLSIKQKVYLRSKDFRQAAFVLPIEGGIAPLPPESYQLIHTKSQIMMISIPFSDNWPSSCSLLPAK
jgi:hypothetical protein